VSMQTDENRRHTPSPTAKGRGRAGLAVLAVGLVGIAGVSATSLGGLGTAKLGADRGSVASCDKNGVSIFYGPITFDSALNAFTMKTFSVRKIAGACRGRTLSVTFRDSSDGPLASLSATVTGARANLTLGTPVRVGQIAGIAVAID
jgi:hypothetical protein